MTSSARTSHTEYTVLNLLRILSPLRDMVGKNLDNAGAQAVFRRLWDRYHAAMRVAEAD